MHFLLTSYRGSSSVCFDRNRFSMLSSVIVFVTTITTSQCRRPPSSASCVSLRFVSGLRAIPVLANKHLSTPPDSVRMINQNEKQDGPLLCQLRGISLKLRKSCMLVRYSMPIVKGIIGRCIKKNVNDVQPSYMMRRCSGPTSKGGLSHLHFTNAVKIDMLCLTSADPPRGSRHWELFFGGRNTKKASSFGEGQILKQTTQDRGCRIADPSHTVVMADHARRTNYGMNNIGIGTCLNVGASSQLVRMPLSPICWLNFDLP